MNEVLFFIKSEFEEFVEDTSAYEGNDDSGFVMGDFTPHYVKNKEKMRDCDYRKLFKWAN